MPGRDPKKYWMSLEEREAFAPRPQELPYPPEGAGLKASRRDFLRMAGFAFAGGALTACSRAPVEKAIPYLIQPEEVIPGRAYYYSSTCGGCTAGCGLLVKNREGRPIKLEGNPGHPLSQGGLCAVGQASILGLYDSQRLKQPLQDGKLASWEEVDQVITTQLEALRRDGGVVRFLSSTITSPTLRAAIQSFLKRFPNARHVVCDPLSNSAILEAHELTHGARAVPRYRFERAEVIASFDADFLGTWISPVEYARGYRAGRMLEGQPPQCSYHVQFESRLSVTGAKADQRIRTAPSEIGLVLTHLTARLTKSSGVPTNTDGIGEPPVSSAFLDDLAYRLLKARGRSLVVCGVQDIQAQAQCNFANHLLGNYGSTVDIERPSFQSQGNDREVESLLRELREGNVKALFVQNVNPVYELPGARALSEALRRVPLFVSLAQRLDETASLAQFVCPDQHYLESWGDAEPVAGLVSIQQPTIHHFGNTRSILESLAAWSAAPQSAYELVRGHWQTELFPRQNREATFEAIWDQALQQGYIEVAAEPVRVKPFNASVIRPILSPSRLPTDAFALVLYSKVGIRDGRHAYNPWLQELPDPISKVAWDNYACISPAAAKRLGVRNGDVVRLNVQDTEGQPLSIELPAFVQPGQHDSVVAVALGYGSKLSARFSNVGPEWIDALSSVGEDGLVGKNAAPFIEFAAHTLSFSTRKVRVTKAGRFHELASTQDHQTLTVPPRLAATSEPRPAIQETTLQEFRKKPYAGIERREPEKEDLWPADHPYTGRRWGMVIDLSACTGCSACVVACQAENNVPVVGKDEVRRKREMHWIRLDRYYSGEDGDVDVAYQPMLCQQCENAPCETVCPVLATVHNAEGLNVQVYNRCVGTRYCANNCPYKTRRFNWFDYPRDDTLQNLVLNPDVTVRSRGVMEKCTFCIQRIRGAEIEAKRTGEALADGAVQTACQQSCPVGAITFGDLNDPKSRVAQLARSGRAYRVLEELNVRPAIEYLTLVRNRDEGERKG